MSAFPLKADILNFDRHVRFVPETDSCSAANSIERSDDFIDQRLHVEVIGWRNADTPTGFFDRTGCAAILWRFLTTCKPDT